MTGGLLRVLWTPEGAILPSGRLCADLRDIDEPCIVELVREETGEPWTLTVTQADCDALAAEARRRSLPHICTTWCAPPTHAELHKHGGGVSANDVVVIEQRDARLLGRTVERIVPTSGVMRATVLALVFFHGGEL